MHKIIGMEFFLGSLCNGGICIKGYRRKSSTSKRPSTESTVTIVRMKNIYFMKKYFKHKVSHKF